MNDDFNTPLAMAVLFELAKEINLTKNKILAIGLLELSGAIGLLLSVPEKYLKSFKSFKKSESDQLVLDEKTIEKMIIGRAQARLKQNFSEADRIRKDLESKGIIIEDTKDGTSWRRG